RHRRLGDRARPPRRDGDEGVPGQAALARLALVGLDPCRRRHGPRQARGSVARLDLRGLRGPEVRAGPPPGRGSGPARCGAGRSESRGGTAQDDGRPQPYDPRGCSQAPRRAAPRVGPRAPARARERPGSNDRVLREVGRRGDASVREVGTLKMRLSRPGGLVLTLAAFTAAGTVSSQSPPQRLTIPAVASIVGRSPFFSDVRVFNTSYTSTVSIAARYRCFLGNCPGAPAPIRFDLAPRESRAFDDMIAVAFQAPNSAGGVELDVESGGTADTLAVTSR